MLGKITIGVFLVPLSCVTGQNRFRGIRISIILMNGVWNLFSINHNEPILGNAPMFSFGSLHSKDNPRSVRDHMNIGDEAVPHDKMMRAWSIPALLHTRRLLAIGLSRDLEMHQHDFRTTNNGPAARNMMRPKSL